MKYPVLSGIAILVGMGLVACDCADGGGEGDPGSCINRGDCAAGEACIDGRCSRDVDGTDGGAVDAGPRPDGGPAMRGCKVSPVPQAFENPARELRWRGEGVPFPTKEQVIVSPVVIDFVEDGPDDRIPEVIFVSYDADPETGALLPGVLRVVSGRAPYDTLMTLPGDGSGPATAPSTATPSLRWDSHPAAGDLDGDGRAEVVAVLESGGAIAWHADGTEYWTASFDREETTPNASVAIADLQHDGTPEVIIGRVVLNGQTGAVDWTGSSGRGNNRQGPLSCVGDLVPGGDLEIAAGRTVYDATGGIVWSDPDETKDGFCAIADVVDAAGASARDGEPELVRVADGDGGGVKEGVVYVHDGTSGEVLWSRVLPWCPVDAPSEEQSRGRGGAPTVADFDGDGLMEIGVAGANCYVVFDPECDTEPRPEKCNRKGILWLRETDDESSQVTSSTVFDFNGDGRAEVVYNDEQYFQVLDGVTGEILFDDANPSRTRTEQPIVADSDNDGNAEIIFSANDEAGFAGDAIPGAERVPGLEIWSSADDSWVGARPVWNQHTYHIDNVGVDGTIPVNEPPSWESHNTYRLNQAEEDALSAPNLGADPVDFEIDRCGEGILRVCARVENGGEVRVGPGIEVTFYEGDPDAGGTAIGSASTTTALVPFGPAEAVCIDWNPAPTEPTEVFVTVDSGGAARECVEEDNTVALGEGNCPPFM